MAIVMGISPGFPCCFLTFCVSLCTLMSFVHVEVKSQTSPCVLIGYDVLNLTKAPYWEFEYNNNIVCLGEETCKFYFSICKPLILPSTPKGPQCENSDVCLEMLPKNASEPSKFLGIANHVDNPFNQVASNQFWATFPVGQQYKRPDNTTCMTSTVLHFMCNENEPWLPGHEPSAGTVVPKVRDVTYEPQTCRHVVSMEYSGACLIEASAVKPRISAGSVLLIICFVGLIVYLCAGATYNHCQGARGKETMPHLEFWEELPKNITAGCTFSWQLLTCQQVPQQSPTYEQL